MLITVALCITVFVPWGIGRNILRDTPLHAKADFIYDLSSREGASYFLADWVGGCIVLTLIMAVVLVFYGIGRSRVPIIAGIAAAALAVFIMAPMNINQWNDAELEANLVQNTSYAKSIPDTCFELDTTFGNNRLSQELYQVYFVMDADEICRSLQFYVGRKKIGEIDVPPVALEPDGPNREIFFELATGKNAQDSWLLYTTSNNRINGSNLRDPHKKWSFSADFYPDDFDQYGSDTSNQGEPQLAYANGTLHLIRGLGSGRQYLEGIDPASGKHKWFGYCPKSLPSVLEMFTPRGAQRDDPDEGLLSVYCGGNEDGDIESYTVNNKGKMKIEEY